MNIYALIHTPFEKPGYILNWADEKGHNLTCINLYEPFEFPDINNLDWLIVMGGPMGVYDEDKFPWLKSEKSFIKKAIENNKIVLGICLGSQLIAEVLGSKVFPNKHKEIGWFKINTSEYAHANGLFSFFPQEVVVFHWHGDTFDLPAGAVHLAESEACKNQAFIFNNKVVALQFHIEITDNLLDEMFEGGRDELVGGEYIQSENDIRLGINHCNTTNTLLHKLLDKMEELLSKN